MMRFVTWNLDWWDRNKQLRPPQELLKAQGDAVIALQEVRGSEIDPLRESHAGGTALFSQELYPGATRRWMGCALLLPSGAEVIDKGVVPGLPKPQRSIWATVRLPGGKATTLVSWHTPNAAGGGEKVKVKMQAYEAMSTWLAALTTPVILGGDFNTWVDPVDRQEADVTNAFFHEHAFVGPHPAHRLLDAYRTVLEANGELDRRRQTAAKGPLAASYRLSDGTPHRMDRIFASEDLKSTAAGYGELAEAQQHGSDHALHWAEFA